MTQLIFCLMIGAAVICLLAIAIGKIFHADLAVYLMLIALIAAPTAAGMYFIPGGPAVQAIVFAVGVVVAVLGCLRIGGKL